MCRTLGRKVIQHLPRLHLEKLELLSLSLVLSHSHTHTQGNSELFSDLLSIIISLALNHSNNVMYTVNCLQTSLKTMNAGMA
jgi:hypothetical protein